MNDAPKTPDYNSLAQQSAKSAQKAVRSATQANRVNQVTPYGSQTWEQTPSYSLDSDKYAAADKKYQTQLTAYNRQKAAFDKKQAAYDKAIAKWQAKGGKGKAPKQPVFNVPAPIAPDYNAKEFQTFNPDAGWESKIELSPDQQAILDKNNNLSKSMLDSSNSAMDQVNKNLANPLNAPELSQFNRQANLQTSIDPNTGMDAWDKATSLLMERINPQLQRDEESLRTRLRNSGLTEGSEAWNTEMNRFGNDRNDARTQATLGGLQAQNQFYNQALGAGNFRNAAEQQSLDNALRNAGFNNDVAQQGFSNQQVVRNEPINLINAMRSGSQVTNPQFQASGQQSATNGTDFLGAGQSQYNADLGASNANNAGWGNMLGGLFNIGSTFMGAPSGSWANNKMTSWFG